MGGVIFFALVSVRNGAGAQGDTAGSEQERERDIYCTIATTRLNNKLFREEARQTAGGGGTELYTRQARQTSNGFRSGFLKA